MEPKGVVAASQPRWIPVTERLPERGKNVLSFIACDDIPKDECIGVDFLGTDGNWFWNHLDHITHWMPLPEPPKEVANES